MKEELPNLPTKVFRASILFSVIAAALLVVMPYHLVKIFDNGGTGDEHIAYSLTLIAILPLVQGLVVAYKIHPYNVSTRKFWLLILIVYFVDSLAATVAYKEGYICLLMAMPFYLALISLGSFVGKGINKLKKKKTINASIIPIILLSVALDASAPTPVFSNAIRAFLI